MMSNPFFSIIIPTYNRSYCISNAIESVLSQSYTDWELIIVDDGSEDDTTSVVARYQDRRIHYFFKNHEERSIARNFGINKATGRFLSFLDSDDAYLSDFLQHNYAAIQCWPDYLIFRSDTIMYKGGEAVKLPDVPGDILTFKDLCYHMNGLPSYCSHHSLFDENSFDPRFFIGEDFHFLARVIRHHDFVSLHKYGFIFNFNAQKVLTKSLNIHGIINKLQCYNDLLQQDFKAWQAGLILRKVLTVILVALYIVVRKPDRYLVKEIFISCKHIILNIRLWPYVFFT